MPYYMTIVITTITIAAIMIPLVAIITTIMITITTTVILCFCMFSRHKSTQATDCAVLDPLEVFHIAVRNATPTMGTTGVRRGGRLYQVRDSL